MTDECFGFERLDVYQKAVGFAELVYRITKRFPREELFGLTSQLRRASVSVAANIAEGSSRESKRDQARFYEIAYGSLNELVALLQYSSRVRAYRKGAACLPKVGHIRHGPDAIWAEAVRTRKSAMITQHSTLNTKQRLVS